MRNRRKQHGHSTDRLLSRSVRQEKNGGFTCTHCKTWVEINEFMGTGNRNHCNHCLWSRHVDDKKGDRRAVCKADMKPVGLTFRIEGNGSKGEIMLIHDCTGCGKISINRIAGDDAEDQILAVYEASLSLSQQDIERLKEQEIYLAGEQDRPEILLQLFGTQGPPPTISQQ